MQSFSVAFSAFFREFESSPMAQPPIIPLADVAQKYLALVEKSRAGIAELYSSGRWKYYYTAPGLVLRAEQLTQLHDLWSRVATLGQHDFPVLRRGLPPGLDADAR